MIFNEGAYLTFELIFTKALKDGTVAISLWLLVQKGSLCFLFSTPLRTLLLLHLLKNWWQIEYKQNIEWLHY